MSWNLTLKVSLGLSLVADDGDEADVLDGVRLAPELGRRFRAVGRRYVEMSIVLQIQFLLDILLFRHFDGSRNGSR